MSNFLVSQSVEDILGIKLSELYAIMNTIDDHYRTVLLPKKSGGSRKLHIPDDRLMYIQKCINRHILSKLPISNYATAYRRGFAIKHNAIPHISKPGILKLDIKHFFDRISYSQVEGLVFRKCDFSEPVRELLSSLCCYPLNSIPQGAPTSPAISNIIMYEFDNDVGFWCYTKGITYTRYCDDMTFSGDFDPAEVTEYVSNRLRKMGFFLNNRKTAHVFSSQRQTVTGIVVNEKTAVPSDYRRKLRQELYYCKKYGIAAHMVRLGVTDDASTYIARLLGRVNYVLSVTPDNKEMLEYKYWLTRQLKQY